MQRPGRLTIPVSLLTFGGLSLYLSCFQSALTGSMKAHILNTDQALPTASRYPAPPHLWSSASLTCKPLNKAFHHQGFPGHSLLPQEAFLD